MKFYVGVTNNKWFKFLADRKPDEVNFWRPGGPSSFQSIPVGAPFLFKLHSPDDFVAGGGFFVSHSNLPLSLAWEAFSEKNGTDTIESLRIMIQRSRTGKPPEHDPVIGCTILANPFFFDRSAWIPAPSDWAAPIVKGKGYDTDQPIGSRLWSEVQHRLHTAAVARSTLLEGGASPSAEEVARYGAEFLTRARLGQGAFRVLVTDAYTRRCAITGERTLPALEAAHIQSFAKSGPNVTANGLLLRSDLHKLFDSGYLSVTPDLSVEISRKIKEEYENGRDYYALHGRKLAVVPATAKDRPSSKFLEWHNSNTYLG
ncbi:MAG TPA: HNH endonuclease [Nitrospiraceae bacterium]|jgi:putative restriction endonuclease|nr:HNH endonuclease [Nitrospiraceae bacterium]